MEKIWSIKPVIEEKIQDITEFIIEKNAFLPFLEEAKMVRKKTLEERIHRDANGAITPFFFNRPEFEDLYRIPPLIT